MSARARAADFETHLDTGGEEGPHDTKDTGTQGEDGLLSDDDTSGEVPLPALTSTLPTPPPWPGTPADEDPHNHTGTEGEEEPHGSSDANQLDRSDTESEDVHQEPDENATEPTAPPALTSPPGVGLHASTIQADTPSDRSSPGDDDGAPNNDTDAPRHRRLSSQDIVECDVATPEARTADDIRR